MQSTALLAGEAVANAEILTIAMKDVDRRLHARQTSQAEWRFRRLLVRGQ